MGLSLVLHATEGRLGRDTRKHAREERAAHLGLTPIQTLEMRLDVNQDLFRSRHALIKA